MMERGMTWRRRRVEGGGRGNGMENEICITKFFCLINSHQRVDFIQ